jgi:F-type H+-transporting ATPase subunit epsilon
MALKVEVVTPERRLVQVDADEVIAPGADGLFGVRPGHTAYLAVLQPGLLTVKEGGGVEKRFFVAGGFCEVADDVVRVLADVAEPLESIDVAAAQKAVTEAEAKLLEISPSLPAYQAQREAVQKAQVRFELAAKR